MNTDAFARLLTDYCLEVQPGQQVHGDLDDARRAAAARAAARGARARGVAAAAAGAARPGRELLERTRATPSSTRCPRPSSPRPSTSTPRCGSSPPRTRTRWPASTPRGSPARAHARRPLREIVLARRWAITLWPTAAAAQQAGMGTADFIAFVERALFLDRDDPVAAWGELREFQARLIERLAPASEIRIEAPGHRPDAERRGPDLGQLRRQAQHAQRRGLHRAARDLRRGPHPLHDPDVAARRGGRGRHARVPRGKRRLGAGGARRRLPAGHARDRRRRAHPRRARDRHELRHRPGRSARSCSTRRSAARSTSRSAARIPRPAARTSPSCTGT